MTLEKDFRDLEHIVNNHISTCDEREKNRVLREKEDRRTLQAIHATVQQNAVHCKRVEKATQIEPTTLLGVITHFLRQYGLGAALALLLGCTLYWAHLERSNETKKAINILEKLEKQVND